MTLQELVDLWQGGGLSDARLAEAVTLQISAMNAVFDRIREQSRGAIDARASVRVSLPRPGQKEEGS